MGHATETKIIAPFFRFFSGKIRRLSGKCLTPTQLLICSSFSRENGHVLLVCSSLSTSQYYFNFSSRLVWCSMLVEGGVQQQEWIAKHTPQ